MTSRAIAGTVLAGLVIGVIALLCFWTQQPWPAPSLGSAAFTQMMDANLPAARPYATAVGQLAGAAAGFAAVYALGAVALPDFTAGHALAGGRVVAIAVAVLLAGALQRALQAKSLSGGATALVVALGAEPPTLSGAGHLVVGILLVTALGELALRAVLRLPAAGRAQKATRVAG